MQQGTVENTYNLGEATCKEDGRRGKERSKIKVVL